MACSITPYRKAVELGRPPGDRPRDRGLFAVGRMVIAWDTYRYRLQFDEDLVANRHDRVHHRIVETDCTRPSLAVSSLFSVDSVTSGDDCLRLSLSVLPLEDTRSVAVFSWRGEEDRAARAWLEDQIPSHLPNSAVRQRLSRLVLANCENIVLTPALVESMSGADRERILAFFLATASAVDDGSEDIEVDLFM
jgi:hypothetical protein